MSDIPAISINITLKTVNTPVNEPPSPSQPPSDDQMQCELWVTCTNPQCFKSGCTNALAQQSKEVSS